MVHGGEVDGLMPWSTLVAGATVAGASLSVWRSIARVQGIAARHVAAEEAGGVQDVGRRVHRCRAPTVR